MSTNFGGGDNAIGVPNSNFGGDTSPPVPNRLTPLEWSHFHEHDNGCFCILIYSFEIEHASVEQFTKITSLKHKQQYNNNVYRVNDADNYFSC